MTLTDALLGIIALLLARISSIVNEHRLEDMRHQQLMRIYLSKNGSTNPREPNGSEKEVK